MKKYLLIVVPIALVVFLLFQQTPPAIEIMMDKLYDYENKTPGYTGYALLLQEGDTYHLRKGYGNADVAGGIRMHPEKTFAAPAFEIFLIKAAFFDQLSQNDISLDTNVHQIFHSIHEADYPEATLQHLISGTSAIDDISTPANTLYAPSTGERTLMISFIEDKSGKSYKEYIDATIIEPAQCVSTEFASADKKADIVPHMRRAGKFEEVINPEVYEGITTSLEDMQRIYSYLFKQIRYAKQMEQSLTFKNGEPIDTFGYWVSGDFAPTVFGWTMNTGTAEDYILFDQVLPEFAYTTMYNPKLDKFFGMVANRNGVETFEKAIEFFTIGNGYLYQLEN